MREKRRGGGRRGWEGRAWRERKRVGDLRELGAGRSPAQLMAVIDWLVSPALLFQIRRGSHTSGNINLQYKKEPLSIGSRETVSSQVRGKGRAKRLIATI